MDVINSQNNVISNGEIEKKKRVKCEEDVALICTRLNEEIEGIEAIFLCGGFGRGEGTWIVKDGVPNPYNDYDVAIVTDTKVDISTIEGIRKKLANEIGIHWVDIDIYSKAKLRKLRVSIKNVDLLYGSKVVYGSRNVIGGIYLNKQKIGIEDIDTLYFTRLWPFFGIVNGDFCALDIDESIFFRNQMAKAILAVVDVLLIRKKSYDCSYVERVKRLENLYPSKVEFLDWAKWALAEKLSPSLQEMSRDESISLYNSVYKLYKNEMLDALSSKYIFKLDSPHKFGWNFYMPLEWAKRIYITKVRGFKGYERACLYKIMQNAMFLAYNGGDIQKSYMSDVWDVLDKLGYSSLVGKDWYSLCSHIAFIRNQK